MESSKPIQSRQLESAGAPHVWKECKKIDGAELPSFFFVFLFYPFSGNTSLRGLKVLRIFSAALTRKIKPIIHACGMRFLAEWFGFHAVRCPLIVQAWSLISPSGGLWNIKFGNFYPDDYTCILAGHSFNPSSSKVHSPIDHKTGQKRTVVVKMAFTEIIL